MSSTVSAWGTVRIGTVGAMALALLQSACGGVVEREGGRPEPLGSGGIAGAPAFASSAGHAGSLTVVDGVAGSPNVAAVNAAGAPALSSGGSPGTWTASGGTPGQSNTNRGDALSPVDGWIEGSSNIFGIQGAVFAYADPISQQSLGFDFTGGEACIRGTATKVDVFCDPIAPATDCYGSYWGVAIGMNLNQPIDPGTGQAGLPLPFDASNLKGFAFDVTGAGVPLPQAFHFSVESSSGESYCNLPSKRVVLGPNTVHFSELVSNCFRITTDPPNPSAETVQSSLIKISWQVATNTVSEVPYDFCISNVRALAK